MTVCTRRSFVVVSLLAGMAGFLALSHEPATAEGLSEAARDSPPPELTPKTCTIQERDIPLGTALAELARQTGNQVEDRREMQDNPRLRLDLKGATFWEALEAIAREADAKVALSTQEGKVALIDGPYQARPLSFSGLFRTAVKRVDVVRILDPETHYCRIVMEVAWEPRFQPYLLEPRPDTFIVQDDKGNKLDVPEENTGPLPVGRRLATEVEIRVGAPKRSAPHLGLLKGTIHLVGTGKMLTFTFDKLTKIEKRSDIRRQTQEGVTVSLREFRMEDEGGDKLWTVGVLLEYPPDGPRFESFQSSLVNNEAYLEKLAGGQRFPVNGGYETEDAPENKAVLRYRFTDELEKKLLLGKPSDWKLVYRTPGKIVEVPVTFEFKELPLP